MILAVGMALTFYSRIAKGLKLKARKFWFVISTSGEVTGEKLVKEGVFTPSKLNKVKTEQKHASSWRFLRMIDR